MSEVKGFAIRGLLRYIKDSKYFGGISAVLQMLPAEDQKVFEQQINASAWYPYTTFVRLLRKMDEKLGRGDLALCRRLGYLSAEKDLSGIFKILLTISSFETLVKRGPLLWNRYFSGGRLVVVENQPHLVRLHIVDLPHIDKAHCTLTEGWLEALSRISGVKDMRVRHTKCRTSGDDVCEFTGSRLSV